MYRVGGWAGEWAVGWAAYRLLDPIEHMGIKDHDLKKLVRGKARCIGWVGRRAGSRLGSLPIVRSNRRYGHQGP